MTRALRRFAALAVLALLAGAPARAQTAGSLGVGAILGDPLGGTAKYFFTGRDAVQLTMGVSHSFVITSDYVWHGWNLTPQPRKGPLGVYLAAGGRFEFQEDELDTGIRTMLGLSYWPKLASRQAEFFLELGPTYRMARRLDGFRVRVDGGFGLRVYFAPSKS